MSSISNRSRVVVTTQIRSEKTRKAKLMCLSNEINITRGRTLPSKSAGAFYEAVNCSPRTVLYSFNDGHNLGLIKDKIRRKFKEAQKKFFEKRKIKTAESELTIQQAIELCKKMNASCKDTDKIYKVSPVSIVMTIRLQDVVPKGQDFSNCQTDRYYESPTYYRSKEEEFSIVIPVTPDVTDEYIEKHHKGLLDMVKSLGFSIPDKGEESNAAYASTFMGKDKAKASYDEFTHHRKTKEESVIEIESINTKSKDSEETERRFVSIVLPSSKKDNTDSKESVSSDPKKSESQKPDNGALDKLAQMAKNLP